MPRPTLSGEVKSISNPIKVPVNEQERQKFRHGAAQYYGEQHLAAWIRNLCHSAIDAAAKGQPFPIEHDPDRKPHTVGPYSNQAAAQAAETPARKPWPRKALTVPASGNMMGDASSL
jgi:hypothetical protein